MRKTLAGAALLAVLMTGCAGAPASGGGAASGQPVTITFWHGWKQPHEVKAIDESLARFRKLHPEITVRTVSNVADDKIVQGIRSGNGPDVVSSFTTDNVGQFCLSGAWLDLAPFLARSGVDVEKTFPKPALEYTQYRGRRCALPLLADAWGLFYNKRAFAEAGIAHPPRTLTELEEDAVKLTKLGPDGEIERLGFMPDFRAYEQSPGHLLANWKPAYFDAQGKSNLSRDPVIQRFFAWHDRFVKALGGFEKLERFRGTMPDEYSPQNAFQTGKVAMQLDGEWRIANMIEDKVDLDYGTAPFPVPDSQATSYGGGFLTGTIIGISRTSRQQNAAWELVKFLTTDTDALVAFAGAIRNVPSTYASLEAFKADEGFRTFIDMFTNPNSTATPASPNGGAYIQAFDEFGFRQEAGKVPDLAAGLADLDRRIDTDIAQVGPR
ncbi:extracellular solute-binding protein [Planotetraspora sp. GP83]|uniref:extracellular solute-binding protein n=1 Tax=Planotetraspora sp. GP83 TaxID=3156264 RepID=UPI003512B6DE